MSEWLPIETAPKDQGAQILGGWDNGVATLERNGEYWAQISDSGRATSFDPTHWMPLPPAPNAGAQVSSEAR